jgi:hypothetical protein
MGFCFQHRCEGRRRRPRGAGAIAIALAALASAGCWQEIQYHAPAEVADANSPDGAAAARDETANGGAASAGEGSTTGVPSTEMPPGDAGGATDGGTSGDAGSTAEAGTPPDAGAAEDPTADDGLTPGELFGNDESDGTDEGAGETAPADAGSADAAPIESAPVDANPGDVPPIEVTPPVEAAVTPAERRDAWTAASDWALAAGVRAVGKPADQYQPYLARAQAAAEALGIRLPELPEASAGAEGRVAIAATALREGEGAELAAAIAERLDNQAGAAARLALLTHALLLSYSPRAVSAEDAAELGRQLAAAGEAAQLPAELWQPLARLLDQQADFPAVKAAVFALRQQVADRLELLARP